MSKTAKCGWCGVTFRTFGNSGGHCTGRDCHRNFIGLSAFDGHRVDSPDGRRVCRDPAEVVRRDGTPLFESVVEGGVTYWRVKPTPAAAERWAAINAERQRHAPSAA